MSEKEQTAVINYASLRRMDARKTPLERAFDMARTGAYRSVEDLKRRLSNEGYDCRQIDGRQLKMQLSALLKAAKSSDPLDREASTAL